MEVKLKNKSKILGLDISTKTIGFALFDLTGKNLLELTHFSPKIKPQPEDKLEELLKKADELFKAANFSQPERAKFISQYNELKRLSGGATVQEMLATAKQYAKAAREALSLAGAMFADLGETALAAGVESELADLARYER